MTQNELKDIINTCYNHQLAIMSNPEYLKDLLKEYADDNNKVSIDDVACFALIEGLNFNRQLLESVLLKVFQVDN